MSLIYDNFIHSEDLYLGEIYDLNYETSLRANRKNIERHKLTCVLPIIFLVLILVWILLYRPFNIISGNLFLFFLLVLVILLISSIYICTIYYRNIMRSNDDVRNGV